MQSMANDPFFAAHREHMNQMNNMFRDPFGGMMGSPFLQLTDGRALQQPQNGQGARSNALMPMDPFGHANMFDGMFGNMNRMMNSMMGGMQSQMSEINTMPQAGNGQFYSHSSVMSYSNDGSGRPKVYQATSSTTQAPGGLRETRKTLRDSERGIEKMSMGRHINDRGHVMTKEKIRTDLNEEEELINLDEGEKEGFEREWREKIRPYSGRHRALGVVRGNDRYGAHRSHHQHNHHQHQNHQHHHDRHHPHQRPPRASHNRPSSAAAASAAPQAAIEYHPESYTQSSSSSSSSQQPTHQQQFQQQRYHQPE